MKKQRKQKPKARSRGQGSSCPRAAQRAQAHALAHQKRSASYNYAVYGRAKAGFYLASWLPAANRVMATARASFEAFGDGAQRVRSFAFNDVPQKVQPHVSRVRHAALAASQSYSTDDRELAALLLLPFLIVASAMVIGQSVRRWDNFDVPVAVQRNTAETQKLARQRAIAAQPMVAIAPLAGQSFEAPSVRASDFAATPLDRFPPSLAKPVSGAETIGALRDAPARVTALVQPSEARPATSDAGEVLAMLTPSAEAVQDLGPGRPIAPPSLVEIPALDDNGSLDGAKHMCLAEPPASKRAVATPQPEAFGRMLADAAREQTESFVIYNDAYRTISYPGGDVPQMFGVCTDVIVRAYRALGIDLQKAVHDAKVGSGDINIDHRRVDVLRRFFAKTGESLPITDVAEDYQPGDIVSYYRPQNQHTRSHIAIVSSVLAPSGRLMIIHNRGWGPQLEDGLFVDQITGHFRYTGKSQSPVLAVPLAKGQRSTQVTPASLVGVAPAVKAPRPKAVAAGN